ncbi:hypothetical protein QCA50_020713 [Cerrena zonata]|uniref:Protein kinase domain-containing protein n=1 Tax=Cerrena zonata TaxID=2478898 RepID=A0AAW0FI73_9APHY
MSRRTHKRVPLCTRHRSDTPWSFILRIVNKERRDVLVKLVPTDGEELKIFQLFKTGLLCEDELTTIIPALDTLTFDERWSFIVMPRWGDISELAARGFNNVECALEFARSMLKGLTILHKNLIAHRDIKTKKHASQLHTKRLYG